MHFDLPHFFLVDQIVLRLVGHQSRFVIFVVVAPADAPLLLGLATRPSSKVSEGPHLRVHECVPQHEFLALDGDPGVRDLVPLLCDGQPQLGLQSGLESGKLVDEGGSDLQVWPPRVQEFKGLQQGPLVLPHDVRSQAASGAALAPNRVHQHALGGLKSLLYELEDSGGSLVFRVQHDLNLGQTFGSHLIVLVQPEEGQVGNSDRLPMVGDLLASAVDDVCDLVGYHEFQVLRAKPRSFLTWLASSSPMKSPSLIFMAPIMS